VSAAPDNYHLEQLEAIRQRYRDKRTLGYRLADDCVAMATAAIVEDRARCEAQLELAARYHQGTRDLADTLKRRIDQLEGWRELKETRSSAAKVTGYEDPGQVHVALGREGPNRTWTVADLEEVAYRLRCGGAVDDTPVSGVLNTISATVPAPNLVHLHQLSERSSPLLARPQSVRLADAGLARVLRFGPELLGVLAALLTIALLLRLGPLS
jgi:hypothetical protein